MPVYPGLIVDANGVFWMENVTWGCSLEAAVMGTFAADGSSSTENYCLGMTANPGVTPDTLAITSAAASGAALTLEGTLTGTTTPTYEPGEVLDGPAQWAWTNQVTLAPGEAQPISLSDFIAAYSAAGVLGTDAFASWVVNADGSFTLWDFGAAPVVLYSNCVYTGQITQADPSQPIFSVTATVSQAGTDPFGNTAPGPCTDPAVADGGTATAHGVFVVLSDGSIAGGLYDGNGAIATLD